MILYVKSETKPRSYRLFCEPLKIEFGQKMTYDSYLNDDAKPVYVPGIRSGNVKLSLGSRLSKRKWRMLAGWLTQARRLRFKFDYEGKRFHFDGLIHSWSDCVDATAKFVIDVHGPITTSRPRW